VGVSANIITRAKRGTVPIASHPGQDLHPKPLNSILRQAGLK